MFLSTSDLRQAHAKGEIRFEPDIESKQFRHASIDLRLGYKISKIKAKKGFDIDAVELRDWALSNESWDKKTLKHRDELGKRESFVIEPNEFIIAQTYEKVYVPLHLVGFVEGRSGFARAGLSVHQSAPMLNPGWRGNITLELFNSGTANIKMTPLDVLPCTVSFQELKTPLTEDEAYGSGEDDKFQDRNSPSSSDNERN